MAVARDGSGSLDFSSYLIQRQAILGVNHSSYGEKGDHGIGFVNNYSSSASPCSSSSSACTSNNGLGLLQYYKPDIEDEGEGGGEEEEEETHDQYSHQLINFQTGPLLNFRQRETEYSVWGGNNNLGDNNGNQNQWFYSEAYVADSAIVPESSSLHKRPHAGAEDMPNVKRHCTGNGGASARKPKPKANSPKDPQSVAAKNRRERISERLKILQDLVPNGSKVDLVTMLEKAISYVKFLQLQVKVLATDEFWPVQGGKAPDISQVKEAIDAILSSQRDRNPTPK